MWQLQLCDKKGSIITEKTHWSELLIKKCVGVKPESMDSGLGLGLGLGTVEWRWGQFP
jgi:hypothetical protein